MKGKRAPMQSPISVTTLNNQIKSLLESHYLSVTVEGEVSRVTYHSSGHLYFTLKDENSAISCVMFRGNNQKLRFRLEEGLAVIVQGGISVYTPRGSYQINVLSMEPAGSGALALAFEQLKKRLEAKGYFLAEHKKPLPKIPRHIAIVTSATGAALQDMLRVAKQRWPLLKITLLDTLVQGEGAAASISANIQKADRIGADLIIVGRGGGSLEDLWAFNEEIVADAIFHARTPVVSAVGHEIDFLISDFVADLRAPTPSAAMEMILPDKTETLLHIDTLMERFTTRMRTILSQKEAQLLQHEQMLRRHSFQKRIALYAHEIESLKERILQLSLHILSKREEEISYLKERITVQTAQILREKERLLNHLKESFERSDPAKKSKRGFAQLLKEGKIVPLESLEVGERFRCVSAKAYVDAIVEKCGKL